MIGVGQIVRGFISQFLTITNLTGRPYQVHRPAFQVGEVAGHLRHGKNADQSYRSKLFQTGFGCI